MVPPKIKVMEAASPLRDRWSGKLSTLEILGSAFFVDFQMEMIRPKDDYLFNGISFSALETYYTKFRSRYEIAFDKVRKRILDIKRPQFTVVPLHLALVAFPDLKVMDAYGFSCWRNIPLEKVLAETPQVMNSIAEVIADDGVWLK